MSSRIQLRIGRAKGLDQCSECGYITDRDVAAAQVVMQRGMVLVADGQSVTLHVEEGCLGTPMKQETPTVRKGNRRSSY
jgi:putative transposase